MKHRRVPVHRQMRLARCMPFLGVYSLDIGRSPRGWAAPFVQAPPATTLPNHFIHGLDNDPGVASPRCSPARSIRVLQQKGMSCVGEAAQICPEVMTARDPAPTGRSAYSWRCCPVGPLGRRRRHPRSSGFTSVAFEVRVEADVPREVLKSLVVYAVIWSPVANTLHDPVHLDITVVTG